MKPHENDESVNIYRFPLQLLKKDLQYKIGETESFSKLPFCDKRKTTERIKFSPAFSKAADPKDSAFGRFSAESELRGPSKSVYPNRKLLRKGMRI